MINFQINNVNGLGERLDQFLSLQLNQYSRSKIQSWIHSGNVLVNGQFHKKNYLLAEDDKITVCPPNEEQNPVNLTPEPIDINIVYEDEEIAVIDKPSGLVVHPGKGILKGTLIHGLLYHFGKLSDVNGNIRPGIVHRLDKDTSGLMVIAKTNYSHTFLADQFKNRNVKKEYCGFTWGIWDKSEGCIDKPISRNKKDPTSFLVSKDGKVSQTNFIVEKEYRHCSLVSFFPRTGRTHQIRVHTSYLGYPIFGDEKYGGGIHKAKGFLPEIAKFYKMEIKKFGRHALHARSLQFFHPTIKKKVTFKAPLPEEFLRLLKSFRLFYG